MFKVNNKDNKYNDFLLYLLLGLGTFHTFFTVSVFDLEEANAFWVQSYQLLNCYNYWRMHKYLTETAAEKVVVSKKTFLIVGYCT